MKKNILLFFLALLLFNCKEEVKPISKKEYSIEELRFEKESKLLTEIITEISNQNINREVFKNVFLPKINKLADINDNYKMSVIIGNKLAKENNIEAFKLGKQNLIKELKKQNHEKL